MSEDVRTKKKSLVHAFIDVFYSDRQMIEF